MEPELRSIYEGLGIYHNAKYASDYNRENGILIEPILSYGKLDVKVKISKNSSFDGIAISIYENDKENTYVLTTDFIEYLEEMK